MSKTYDVVYELDDGYWVVDIPKLRGAHTQARTIATARGRAREVIALITDQDAGAVELGGEEFRLPERVAAAVAAALDARERAAAAEADAAAKLRRAAVAVAHLTGTRDAGELLGLSHGRIHQLVTTERARRPGGGRSRR